MAGALIATAEACDRYKRELTVSACLPRSYTQEVGQTLPQRVVSGDPAADAVAGEYHMLARWLW